MFPSFISKLTMIYELQLRNKNFWGVFQNWTQGIIKSHWNFQWPITDEIFSKVERITNTDSDPSTSSLPPYNAIPFDTVTVQGAQAQKERT